MSDDDYEKLHPVLNEVTNTLVDLYQNSRDDASREKLIKLEKLLSEHLDKVRDAQK